MSKQLADLLYPNVSCDMKQFLDSVKKRELVKGAEVTRFAPSPTGYLHIGSFFSAFLDRLIADATDGIFYLRLEDTDGKRLIAGTDKIAIDMLNYFGITIDEGYHYDGDNGEFGPYQQSKRKKIYEIFAKELVKNGRAYPCFCGQNVDKAAVIARREESLKNIADIEVKDSCRELTFAEVEQKIKEGAKFALRLKSIGDANKKIEVIDAIKGKRELSQNEKDAVLIKSDGIPVYAFAHVVDDTLMGTTLVVRGEEYVSSITSHIEMFEALGLAPIKYAHTPLLMKLDNDTGNKRKISKRYDPEANMMYYVEMGYPVDAVKEYLLNLLNSNFEIWRKQNSELHYNKFPFELKKVGTSNPLFDIEKLNNISKGIISKLSAEQVYKDTLNYAQIYDKNFVNELSNTEKWIKVFSIDRGGKKPRKDISHLAQVSNYYSYFYTDFELRDSLVTNISKDDVLSFVEKYSQTFIQFEDNSQWFEHLKAVAIECGFGDNKDYKTMPEKYIGNVADAAKIIRYAITGKYDSPQLFEICNILGISECKRRLSKLC